MFDACTRVTWLFILKIKFDVGNIFPNFLKMVKNQFGVSIKRFRFDNARIILTKICQLLFKKKTSFMNHLVLTHPNKMVL